LESDNDEWPFVSVIIVNHNAGELLFKTVYSVLNSDYPKDKLEVIIIDNGSTNGSMHLILNKFHPSSNFTVIRNRENLGWCKAVNMGIKMAKGDFIACLNHDVVVTDKWLKEVIRVMKANSKIAICQCYSLSPDGKAPDSAMNYLDLFGYAYSYVAEKEPTEVTFAEAMAWVINRKVIDDIGDLDEDIFIEYDDQDFCWRAILAGYKIVFVPSAIVYHYRGRVEGPTYFYRPRRDMLYVRNHLNTLIKHLELRNLAKVIPIVLAIEFGKAIYLFIKGKQEIAFATVKGLFSVLRGLKATLRKRWIIQHKIRRIRDKEAMRYFVRFNPHALKLFLSLQERGKRLIKKGSPLKCR